MLSSIVVGDVVFGALPGHSMINPGALSVMLAAIQVLTGLLSGSGGGRK